MKNKIGVLVMSYGTPESMEGIESYYTHIRRGISRRRSKILRSLLTAMRRLWEVCFHPGEYGPTGTHAAGYIECGSSRDRS